MTAHPLNQCRMCGAPFGPVFCDLGTMAVANSYLPDGADFLAEPLYALRAVVCSDCRMVQLDHIVDATGIFSDYAYFSSASSSWVAHAAAYCAGVTDRLSLTAHSFVVEVASNDGYLLRNFVAAGIPCLGVEPAANVAAQAIAAGIPTRIDFLTPQTAAAIVAEHGQADLVIANNVTAHVPDINGFTAGLAMLLKPQGTLTVEAPHLLSLIDGVQFDTIYHEHYTYWSLYAMERLFTRHGLSVHDIEHLPTHGGSLRVFASPTPRAPSAALVALRDLEAQRGIAADDIYQGFNARVAQTITGFRAWLAARHGAGRSVAAYGAAAKGNTFLNAAQVRPDDLTAVADLAPSKQGRRLPGSHIPVISPADLMGQQPDDILILPWNIASEITAQLRDAGFAGTLWTAVPEMRER